MAWTLRWTALAVACVVAGCSGGDDNECSSDLGCETGERCCGNVCVDVLRDFSNCGACGIVCGIAHGGGGCVAGRCIVNCDADYGDCNNDHRDGCEMPLLTTNEHCGACGRRCTATNANAICEGGACGLGTCHSGFANCDNAPANGCETALNDDPAHCGACGSACNLPHAIESCASATCRVQSCEAGWLDCNDTHSDGCELDALVDNANCGECGNACTEGNSCQGGECRPIALIGYGGLTGPDFNLTSAAVWRYVPSLQEFEGLAPLAPNGAPGRRAMHVAAWDTAGGRMILFGGRDTSTLADSAVWTLSIDAAKNYVWGALPPSAQSPGGRYGLCAGHDDANRKLYVYGGANATTRLTDLWALDIPSGQWVRLHSGQTGAPSPRSGFACAFDPATQRFIVFGGLDANSNLITDSWAISVAQSNPEWVEITSAGPEPRNASVFIPSAPPTLFGGTTLDEFGFVVQPNDAWDISGETAPTWAQHIAGSVTPRPPGRELHMGAIGNGRWYVFGGLAVSSFGGTVTLRDLWEFDPVAQSWTQIFPQAGAPTNSIAGTMVGPP